MGRRGPPGAWGCGSRSLIGCATMRRVGKGRKLSRTERRERRARRPEAGVYGLEARDAEADTWTSRYVFYADSAAEARERIRRARGSTRGRADPGGCRNTAVVEHDPRCRGWGTAGRCPGRSCSAPARLRGLHLDSSWRGDRSGSDEEAGGEVVGARRGGK